MPQKTNIQIRRGTSQEWSCANPTLAQGEPGFENDTGKFKIGDGTSPWNDLPYVSFNGGDLDANEISQNRTFTSESGTQIALSSFFDTYQSVRNYKGVTGGSITVPQGYDLAVYIDSNGNVTQEQVAPGQIIYFKSEILLGQDAEGWTCSFERGCRTIRSAKSVGFYSGDYSTQEECEENCDIVWDCDQDEGCLVRYLVNTSLEYADAAFSKEACEIRCKKDWGCDENQGCKQSDLFTFAIYSNNHNTEEDCKSVCKKYWNCDRVVGCLQDDIFSSWGDSQEECEKGCIPRIRCDRVLGCVKELLLADHKQEQVANCSECCFQADGSWVAFGTGCDIACNPNACQDPTCQGNAMACSTCVGQPNFKTCDCSSEYLTEKQLCECTRNECKGAWCEECFCKEGTFLQYVTPPPGKITSLFKGGGVCEVDGASGPNTLKCPDCSSSSSSSGGNSSSSGPYPNLMKMNSGTIDW